jgi:hypothetical protein
MIHANSVDVIYSEQKVSLVILPALSDFAKGA